MALLTTLIVLFSLNGDVLLSHPDLIVIVSVPLIVGFVIVVGYNLLVTRLFGMHYREAIITVIIGSSSHFEIAIATAIGLYGLGSQAALGTTMGLFWEVPIMLSLVWLGKRLNGRGFWKNWAYSKGPSFLFVGHSPKVRLVQNQSGSCPSHVSIWSTLFLC